MATAAAIEEVEPLLVRLGWRLVETRTQPLRRLLRYLASGAMKP